MQTPSPLRFQPPALTRQVSKALLQLVLDVGGAEWGDVVVHDFIWGESRRTHLSFGGNSASPSL